MTIMMVNDYPMVIWIKSLKRLLIFYLLKINTNPNQLKIFPRLNIYKAAKTKKEKVDQSYCCVA